MGLLDMLFQDQDQPKQAQASVDPNAINPIYGVPEALIQEMKKEQQRADMSSAWSNLFGGAANIARGVQGGPPIYDPSSAGGDPNAAMDNLAKRVMMFSQLRQNYEQQAQAAAMKKMLPDVAKKLGVPVEALAQLPDAEKTKYIMAAMAPVAPEQVNIKVPQGEVTALKVVDPITKAISYRSIDGQPLNMAQISQQVGQAAAEKKALEAEGTARGEKRAGLETTLGSLDDMNMLVQQVLDDPNLPKAVGAVWDRGASFIPGTDAYGTGQRIEQLKSKAFLSSIGQMRGMGSLSNAEGMKVEAALGRLNAAQNEKDFRNSLGDVQKSLARLREVAMKEAGVAPSTSSGGDSQWVDTDLGGRFRRKY